MIVCADCTHFIPFDYKWNRNISRALGRCALTPIVLNTVSDTGQHRFCAQERRDGQCGTEGKRFEPVKQLAT